MPPILEKPINVFMGSPVYVNGLLIDTKEKEYYFDVSMNFKEAEGGPFAFFGKITFDGIGLQIKHKGKPEEK